MTRAITIFERDGRESTEGESGFGALETSKGVLPLRALDVQARLEGLLSLVSIRQTFVNTWDVPLEATYIFPLPDRAAVSAFRMEVAGRVVDGTVKERGKARREYDQAISDGHRAGIAEEERPGVFTLRVGNLPPGEQATIELTLCGTLPFADGEVTFRFPLVVAPRYIPGNPVERPGVGDGVAFDTDAVPDASRISPPVLLPGFPNPVRLSLAVEIRETLAAVDGVKSSLHAVLDESRPGIRRIALTPGERLDRDFILRYRLGDNSIATAASVHPGAEGEGTFAVTIIPPTVEAAPPPPRDVVFVLDRSGSMTGWKMVAARRAIARMVDSLVAADRFNVIIFDTELERPEGFPTARLVEATDRLRFRAVEYLAKVDSRGGTEMEAPLNEAMATLAEPMPGRERVIVLVTDGQVGNEGQLLKTLGKKAKGIHIVTVGIDQAVNETFLRRLSELGGPRSWSECVESEDRLDDVMVAIQRRIGAPVLTNLSLEVEGEGTSIAPGSIVPGRIPDLFAGVPVLVLGRYQGKTPTRFKLKASEGPTGAWGNEVEAQVRENPAIGSVWARGKIRMLEDEYIIDGRDQKETLEKQIVGLSEQFQVLSRFTAYLAVDRAEVIEGSGELHRVIQPVEMPSGWAEIAMPAACAAPVPPLSAVPGRKRFLKMNRSDGSPPSSYSPPEREELFDAWCQHSQGQGGSTLARGPAAGAEDLDMLSDIEADDIDPVDEARNLAGELAGVWRVPAGRDQGDYFRNNPDWMIRLELLIEKLNLLGQFAKASSRLEQLLADLKQAWSQGIRIDKDTLKILNAIDTGLRAIAKGRSFGGDDKKSGWAFWKS
ncbi:VIT domain-containing protein [Singulisphaera sp. PoT]|uniref:VIT domain-containing protein n=1 Tax=Singulisphaera sp. PoT TaxID=3411797 RepID=UPI003BF59DD9